MEIRKAAHSDIDQVADLIEQLFTIEEDFVFERDKTVRALEMLINEKEKACVLIAVENGKAVGMCTVQVLISTAEGGKAGILEDMVVSEECRGLGTGAALLSAMEKWAAGNGLTRLQLLADKNNSPALDFYAKNNWSGTRLICLRKKFG